MSLQPLASKGVASPSFPLIGVHLEGGPEDRVGDAGANRGHAGEQARGQSRGHGGHRGCTTQHRSTKHSTPWTRTACAERKGPDTLCDPKFIQVLSSRYVTSDSLRPHELLPVRLLHPWNFPGKGTRVGCLSIVALQIVSAVPSRF